MKRRKFLEVVCSASAGLVIAGSAIDLASIGTLRARSRLAANDVREVPISLEDTPDLKPVGGTYHLSVEDLEREILVVHVSKDQYIAVDIKCKHKGCDINYEAAQKKFICPCHGSEYDLAGANLKGPSVKPLNYYHAELRGNEVVVTVYGPDDKPPENATPPKDTTHREAVSDSSVDIPANSPFSK
ncbi:MAG: Rieske (2Fe-2S) protein [Bacteroidota bacterium]|nr:Rieske (2Fe-2S) protein [Bacteroidota bacterium]MDP4233158.1 Rieske (2Fe-2S) protein [Bacteroidota bacterium]MDP4241697.1 Rieske (2Fe-2S) protein [Bacteroidota bacterium]MDP4287355.1 Rieske (2Fe-2S) protein [Bacteroidota bacterium]